MEEKNWMELFNSPLQAEQLMKINSYTSRFGLELKEEDIRFLIQARKEALAACRRVEFREGILPKLIYEFCDSEYLEQEHYRETLARLQEMFYWFRNETMDLVTDEELLHFMREQFDGVCGGDLDYLEGACLPVFAQEVRSGLRRYERTEG